MNWLKQISIIVSFIFFVSQNRAQDNSNNNPGYFIKLNYNQLFAKTNVDSVDLRYKYARLAYEIAIKKKDAEQCIQALINYGKTCNHQYRYDMAMEMYLKAKKIADSINQPTMKALVLHEIGCLYLDMRNLQLAHDFLSRSLEIKKNSDDEASIAGTINSLALTYWLQGKLDTALNYLFESLKIWQITNNQDGISRAYNNIGIVYHEKKDYQNSLIYLFKALEINEKESDFWSIAETCNNIGETFISLGKYAEAESYLAKARDKATKIKALLLLADNYRYMSRLNKRIKKYDKALQFYELFKQLEDSIFNRNKYTIISELKSSFEIEKREQSIHLQRQKIELLEEKERTDNLHKTFLTGFILLILVAGAIIYNRQKKINTHNRMLLEKDKQIQQAQSQLMKKEKSEKERLSSELEQTNKFLIDFGLYIGMKNEFIVKIKDELKKIARKNEKIPEVKQIVLQLNQNLRTNRELIELQKNVEKVNYEFIQKLLFQFPDITENEKHLAILLRLNFSSKEIADLRAVSIKAVEMSRYRLRKRFNLDKQESLTHFLQNL